MTPQEMLSHSQNIEKALIKIDKTEVAIGITKERATTSIYDDKNNKTTASEVGARHEFGVGVPQRSFLRATWDAKASDIEKIKTNIFKQMIGLSMEVEDGFDFLGVALSNFSKEAFNSGGFGQWQPLSSKTLAAKLKKGSSSPLILVDTGVLRSSISYETRRVSNVA